MTDSFQTTEGYSQLLASIIIYNYDSDALESTLASIFEQQSITSFEVVICDDATSDESWKISNKFADRYPSRITLTRNQAPSGNYDNLRKGVQMCKGKFFVDLTRDRPFDPNYVRHVISQLESDPLFVHSFICRRIDAFKKLPPPELKRSTNPLVSVCIYNYNYGRFLKQCLQSVAEQTYGNIEICFSDNASTDESWQIAMDFAQNYPNPMSMTRNRMNFGASANLTNCFLNYRGKYMVTLCSDDAIKPQFVERCVTLLEKHPEAAFAMVHRDIIDDNNQVTPEPAFYDRTCLIPGEEQAAVYMMAAVNPSISQILYNRERIAIKDPTGGFNGRWFGARILDFNLCSEYPMIYINEPLLLNRVHPLSDGASIDGNLMQCIGQFVLLHQFSEIASTKGLNKVTGRLNEAIEKVGKLCLRYSARFLLKGDETTASRYLHLAKAIFPDVSSEPVFSVINSYFDTKHIAENSKQEALAAISGLVDITSRSTSYAPPPGSTSC